MNSCLHWRPRLVEYPIRHCEDLPHLLRRYDHRPNVRLHFCQRIETRDKESRFRSRAKQAESPDDLLCLAPGVRMIVHHGLAPGRVAASIKVFGADFVEVPPDTGQDASVPAVTVA
jgi:hypothetical protein